MMSCPPGSGRRPVIRLLPVEQTQVKCYRKVELYCAALNIGGKGSLSVLPVCGSCLHTVHVCYVDSTFCFIASEMSNVSLQLM